MGSMSTSGDRWETVLHARAVDHLLMVAGGIGQTPFVTVAQECLACGSTVIRRVAWTSAPRHAVLLCVHG